MRGGGQRSPRWVSWLGLKTEKTAQTLDHVSRWLRDSRPHSLSITTMPIDLITSALPPVDASRTRPTKLGVKAITGRSATAATHLRSPLRPLYIHRSPTTSPSDQPRSFGSRGVREGRRPRRRSVALQGVWTSTQTSCMPVRPPNTRPPPFNLGPSGLSTADAANANDDGAETSHPLDFGGAVARTARR